GLLCAAHSLLLPATAQRKGGETVAKPSFLFGTRTALSLRRTRLLGACLCVVALGRAASAQDFPPPPPVPPVSSGPAPVPAHLSIDDRTFDARVAGLRAYLDTIKSSNPKLHARLAPRVDALESRETTAHVLVATGFAVGLGTVFFAFASRSDCALPSANDPSFGTRSDQWSSCN